MVHTCSSEMIKLQETYPLNGLQQDLL